MTAQAHERLIYNGEETSIACCPFLPFDHPRIASAQPDEFSTACRRGYVGTWEIKDGRFFLVEIHGSYRLLGKGPLFADWFTGVLGIPRGELLSYVHGDFTFEGEVRVSIEQGLVVETRVIDNRPPPRLAARLYKQGRALRLKGDHDKSIAALTEAIRLYPDYADAYYVRGLGYDSTGDYDRSLADLRKVLELQPGAIQVRSTFSDKSFLILPWEDAQNDIDREIAHVRYHRGMAFMQKGDYEMAVADFTESIKFNPKPEFRLARGKAYYALGQFNEAIDDLNEFSLTNPKEEDLRFDINYRLGKCYLEIRSFWQAILTAGIAIRLDPNDPESYFVRGRAYLERDEYTKAVTDLTEAIRLRAAWTDAYFVRAKAYRALGDETKAAEDLIKAERRS